jgi:DNA-nicking Smr family endonuclease
VTAKPKEPLAEARALQADREARERLGALVGGGVRFDMQLEPDGYVQALRQGASRKALAMLESSAFRPESTLDLHGQRAADAGMRVHDFVRAEHRNGARRLLLIVGKGTHSADGVGVLGGIVREALGRGGAAPLVQAFASAHPTLGGRGALCVLLR